MTAGDVSVATITLARDGREEQTIVDALARLCAHGMPVFVADGGSRDAFVDRVRALGNVTVVTGARGLVPQVKASIGAARSSGRPWILYTEPDKTFFFAERLATFLAHAADGDRAGAALAARSDESFGTFPAIQQYTENVASRLTAEVVGQPGDYFYGPFVVSVEASSSVDEAPDDLGWGWRPFVFVACVRRGYALRHVQGDYPCPLDQRDRDETIHRLRQLAQNVNGIAAAASRSYDR